ncbi:hypothetical protein D9M68_1002820 [compost metagenome]
MVADWSRALTVKPYWPAIDVANVSPSLPVLAVTVLPLRSSYPLMSVLDLATAICTPDSK